MMFIYFAVTIILQQLLPQLSYGIISLKNAILSLIMVVISSIILNYFHNCFPEGWIRLISTCLLSVLIIPLLSYFVLFDKNIRKKIIKLIINKIF